MIDLFDLAFLFALDLNTAMVVAPEAVVPAALEAVVPSALEVVS